MIVFSILIGVLCFIGGVWLLLKEVRIEKDQQLITELRTTLIKQRETLIKQNEDLLQVSDSIIKKQEQFIAELKTAVIEQREVIEYLKVKGI